MMAAKVIIRGFLASALYSQSLAQSLLDATARISVLSDFNAMLLHYPDAAADLLSNFTSADQRQTVLVPSNDAFTTFRLQHGASISSLTSSDVGNILNYHTLQGALSSSDLQTPGGLVSSTALRNTSYDDREVLQNSNAKLSQVVYISSARSGRIVARQAAGLSSTDVRSGEGNEITLNPTPGNWSGGTFYIVDGYADWPGKAQKPHFDRDYT